MEFFVVAQWVVGLALLTGIGAPLAAATFPRFPRRGAAFALPAALLPVALLTFWIGQVTFGYHTIVLSVVLTAGLSVVALRRGHHPDWPGVWRAFGLFLVAFAFLLFFRSFAPTADQFAGEQFLHFGLVKSLERAPALPPEDLWFAGEPLRYYYGTQLQVTLLSMLSGTALRFGFNLGVATFYGVLFVSAYGLAAAIADARGYSMRLGGLLGAVFVAVGGATTTAVRLVIGALPDDLAVEYGDAAFGFAAERFNTPLPQMIAEQGDPVTWSWWDTRYVVPGTLQEFPLYSFVKADLHGHALSTGYVVVAAAIAVAYYRTPAEQRWRRRGLLFGGLGLLAGVFGFMNTWSLPTAVGLAWLAVAAADAHPATLLPTGLAVRLRGPTADASTADPDAADETTPDGNSGDGTTDQRALADRLLAEGWRVVLGAIVAALVGFVGVVLSSPFLVFGHVPQNEGIGLFPPTTDLLPFLVIYGGLVVLTVVFLIQRTATADRPVRGPWALGASAALVAVLLGGFVAGAPVVGLLVPILVVAWWLVRTDRAGAEVLLIVAGLGLVLSMELVFAKVAPWPDLPRWNTSLKVAVQGWTLAGVGVGVAAAMLLQDGWARIAAWRDGGERIDKGPGNASISTPSVVPSIVVLAIVLAVVLASLPFAALATTKHVGEPLLDGDEMTIDALDGHERFNPGELAAIQWLDRQSGTPVVATAPGEAYSWTSYVSVFSGLPTVVGWQNHEENYRGEVAVDNRVAAVDAIYEGPWVEATDALDRYEVSYVYVGAAEREQYGDNVTARFANRTELTEVFSNDGATVYAVDET